MRFTAMYLATVREDEEDAVVRETFDAVADNERSGSGIVDSWIDEHFDKVVRCMICGVRAQVNPNDESEMVVSVSSEGGAVILCEECLGIFAFTSIVALSNDKSDALVGRLVVELGNRKRDRAANKVRKGMGGLIAMQFSSERLQSRIEAGSDTSPVRERDLEGKLKAMARGLKYEA